MSSNSNQMPNSEEVVDVNTMNYYRPDFRLRYSPYSGYSVNNGTIASVDITIRVRSNGEEFIITRDSNGRYRTNSSGTHITRR